MSGTRPFAILVCAVGGQGGGVLADWIAEAAYGAGYRAQATSIPGVAQRTGATTYYIELAAERDGTGEPVFCLFPSAGNVDLVVALEPVEAVRALQNGHAGGETTVVTAAARVYAIGEKIVAGDGTLPAAAALDILRASTRRLVAVDGAGDDGGSLNARLFGAVAATGVLPFAADDCRQAIAAVGLAPGSNLAEFERGFSRGREPEVARRRGGVIPFAPAPPGFQGDLKAFPKRHRPLVAHALARLVDYQGDAYARRYLERLRAVARADPRGGCDGAPEPVLTAIVARRLAAWMTFEDPIRVAQIKTRPGRFARIRAEVQARRGEPVDVVDYLTPSWKDAGDLLPERPLRAFAPRTAAPLARAGRPLKLRTSGVWGYAALKLLSALRPLRPASGRFVREQRAIDAWLRTILTTAPYDYVLACRLAELASLALGYGDSGASGAARLSRLLSRWPERLRTDGAALANDVASLLESVRRDPDTALTHV